MDTNKPNASGDKAMSDTPSAGPSASDFSHLPRGLLGKKGLPVGRGARYSMLPSIRSPRDLTLGGTPKRTFIPNIPVRRDRTKDGNSQISDGRSHSDRGASRGMRGRGGERGRGRGRGQSLIQTQGSVFGEGLANTPMKKGSHGDYSRDDTKSQMTVPKYTSTPAMTKKEKEEEEMHLKDLLRDDFIDDDDEKMDYKLQPVTLPLTKSIVSVKAECKLDTKIKPKLDVKIKVEHPEIEDMEDTKIKLEAFKKEKKEEIDEEMPSETEEITPKDIFCDADIPEMGKLLFFQFPNCLPGSLKQDEDVKPIIKKESGMNASPVKSQSSDNQNGSPSSNTCQLGDLPEGYIGKLQVLKSGKTRLVMGSLVFNIEMGTSVGFLQDLVSVQVGEDSGDMTVLGHVQDKLVCIPDVERLLSDCT